MYKYFEISEDNLKFINEFKAEQGIKSDKEAFNKIIELYRDSTAEDKNKKMNKKMVTNKMSSYGRSKRVKREKWANRMAVLGVTMVVICLAAAVNAKGSTLKKSDLDYQQKEQQLEAQLRDEEERTKKLEEYKVYVKTKQFAEEVAKQMGK